MLEDFVKIVRKSVYLQKVIYSLGRARSEGMYSRIKPFLREGESILDIGAGACTMAEILIERGFQVTPLDIRNLSFVDKVTPVIYDGRKIPFGDNMFDVSLVLTVLHHTKSAEGILKEASRVSGKVIVMEEVYENIVQKYLTFAMDSLLNLEFINHPHSNRKDREWKEIFKSLGLTLKGTDYETIFGMFKSATYFLEKGE